MKYNKVQSVVIILVHYLIALIIGWLSYRGVQGFIHPYWALFVADAVATVYVWALGLVYKNVSFYDPYWSVAPPVILSWWMLVKGTVSLGGILMLLAVWYWAIRLTYNWYFTFQGMDHEDWRYTKFRVECHPFIFHIINFFGLNMVPTIVVFLAMIPAFDLLSYGGGSSIFTYLGFALSVVAATLQLLSDRQAHRFRKANPGKVCNVGLWKHGRHPNYLGEILMWWGVWIMYHATSQSIHVWYILGPLSVTVLFLTISIPLMETRQLSTKPEYAEYKRNTRLFI